MYEINIYIKSKYQNSYNNLVLKTFNLIVY